MGKNRIFEGCEVEYVCVMNTMMMQMMGRRRPFERRC